jgi:branched-chain amino acid transport system permease protein
MNLVLQGLVWGIVLGSIYAVLAFGLSLVYGVMRVVNFAHGILAVLAAYVAYQLFQSLGLDPFLSLGVSIPLFFALGCLIYKGLLLGKLGRESEYSSLLVTFGFGIALEVIIILLWTTRFKSITTSYSTSTLVLGPIRLSYARLIAVALAIIMLILLRGFLERTRIGKAIRAVTQDRETAMYMGINVEWVCTVAFGIATAAAAVGGTLLGVVYAFYPAVHLNWTARLFAVVVLGGMGSVVGAFLGSYLVAIAESFVALFLGVSWSPLIGFLTIVIVLLIRPSGLMGLRIGGRS